MIRVYVKKITISEDKAMRLIKRHFKFNELTATMLVQHQTFIFEDRFAKRVKTFNKHHSKKVELGIKDDQ